MEMLHGTEAKDKIWSLVKDIKVAQMATFNRDGQIFHARPMMAQQTEFDGTLWFFTNSESRKAEEIRENPMALLTYAEPKDQNYVSISGKAYVEKNQAKINELWTESARTWFPKGKEDPSLTLIRFEAEDAEFMDSQSSAAMYAFGYIKARLTGKPPEVSGQMGHAEFQKVAG